MVNTTYNSTRDMIDKLQQLKGKTKLKFSKNINNYYTEMKNKNFQTQDDPFSKNAQGISKIYHEVLLLLKFLQTKPQIKIMNINYYDLSYTVIKVRDENKDVDNQYEDDENNCFSFNDIVPNLYIGIKNNNEILKKRIIFIHIILRFQNFNDCIITHLIVSISMYKYKYNCK